MVADAAPSAAPEPRAIRITWYGYACFRLETAGVSLVTDPYTPARARLELDAVAVCHVGDVGNPAVVVPMHHATPSLRYVCGPVEDVLDAYDPEQVVRHDSSTRELAAVEPTGGPTIHVRRPLLDPVA